MRQREVLCMMGKATNFTRRPPQQHEARVEGPFCPASVCVLIQLPLVIYMFCFHLIGILACAS